MMDKAQDKIPKSQVTIKDLIAVPLGAKLFFVIHGTVSSYKNK